jgi:hypothetical protein
MAIKRYIRCIISPAAQDALSRLDDWGRAVVLDVIERGYPGDLSVEFDWCIPHPLVKTSLGLFEGASHSGGATDRDWEGKSDAEFDVPVAAYVLRGSLSSLQGEQAFVVHDVRELRTLPQQSLDDDLPAEVTAPDQDDWEYIEVDAPSDIQDQVRAMFEWFPGPDWS